MNHLLQIIGVGRCFKGATVAEPAAYNIHSEAHEGRLDWLNGSKLCDSWQSRAYLTGYGCEVEDAHEAVSALRSEARRLTT